MEYRQTPPIQWMPMFEAAATTLSFKRAAELLHVSPPAVSQQIKTMEDWLGVKLFERHARQLSLTEEGEYYLQVASKVMRDHKKGYVEFQRRFQSTALHVSTPLFIAQELMIPNYLSYSEYSPKTELRIEARTSYVDFDTESLDVAIRFGDGNWPGLDCRRLCHTYFSPVCSPAYIDKGKLSNVDDLIRHRLISTAPDLSDWKALLSTITQQEPKQLICDSYLAAMKAASEGLGVGLALLPSTNNWINEGRLSLPFKVQIKANMGYWMVAPQREKPNRLVDEFYEWSCHLFESLPDLNQKVDTVDIEQFM